MGTGRITLEMGSESWGLQRGQGIRTPWHPCKAKEWGEHATPAVCNKQTFLIVSLSLAQLSKKEHLITEFGSWAWSAESSSKHLFWSTPVMECLYQELLPH